MNDIKQIDHIGIAVKNLDESIDLYRKLGFKISSTEEVPDQKVKIAFVETGESRIELLEPSSPKSPIAKFIVKKGPGIHHMAVQVDDLKAKLTQLKKDGIRLIDKQPRSGSHGLLIAFIHPKATDGVLLELCEKSD